MDLEVSMDLKVIIKEVIKRLGKPLIVYRWFKFEGLQNIYSIIKN